MLNTKLQTTAAEWKLSLETTRTATTKETPITNGLRFWTTAKQNEPPNLHPPLKVRPPKTASESPRRARLVRWEFVVLDVLDQRAGERRGIFGTASHHICVLLLMFFGTLATPLTNLLTRHDKGTWSCLLVRRVEGWMDWAGQDMFEMGMTDDDEASHAG